MEETVCEWQRSKTTKKVREGRRTYLRFVLIDDDASSAVIVAGHCWSTMSLTTAATRVVVAAVAVLVQLATAAIAPTSFIHAVRSTRRPRV